MSNKPRGELTTRTLAMPAYQNPAGDILGGWMPSQMDLPLLRFYAVDLSY